MLEVGCETRVRLQSIVDGERQIGNQANPVTGEQRIAVGCPKIIVRGDRKVHCVAGDLTPQVVLGWTTDGPQA